MASLFKPTTSLTGNQPPTILRGENLILRGPIDDPYFEVFPGNLNLNENYNLDTTPTKQVETATVIAAGGITGDGDALVIVTSAWLAGSPLSFLVPVTIVTHTTAALIAGAIRTALAADSRITAIFTAGGAGANVSLTDTEFRANDPTLNISIANGTCTGITAAPTSTNTTPGVAGFKLTGAGLSYVTGSNVVSGSGTAFKSELGLGELVSVSDQVFSVKEVVSDTSFLADRPADATAGPSAGYRLPQMSESDKKRVVMLTGNLVDLNAGHKIAVGRGEVFINGSALAGQSLTASNKARAAIFRPSTNDFIIRPLGFATTPPKPTVAMTGSGGTKAMPIGNKISFMFSYWTGTPEGTDGYSNPCEVLKLDVASNPIKVGVANDRFEVDFTTSLVGMPSNAKGFIIWASKHGAKAVSTQGATVTTTSPNETYYENGPWYKVAKVLTTSLTAGDKYTFDFLDEDLYERVSGDNFAPFEAEFITLVEGKPMYISCLGKATTGVTKGTNPGKYCSVAKFGNPDGTPAEWIASCSGPIIGFFEGVGRWFMMTPGSLDFIVSTGLFGQSQQGGEDLELPIISRPYWKTGAANRYSIILVDDTLVGFSGGKFFKSVGNGDENVQKYDFGAFVEDLINTSETVPNWSSALAAKKWYPGHVYAANDPKNTQVCFINSASHRNASGYWCSVIMPFSISRNAWLPWIVLSETDRDMIVSGVATVDEKFEFLAGGRVSGGTFQTRTYRFGEGTGGAAIPWYLVWQPTDDGLENASKQIHSFRATGKFTSANIQVHGARPGGAISLSNMETGTGSISGNISVPNTTVNTRYLEIPCRIKNLGIYAIRLSGTWSGSGVKERLDELIIELSSHGRAR
jgi:hypothetical protein